MEVHSKTCWAWDAIDDLQEPEIGERDVRAAEACAQLTFVPTVPAAHHRGSQTSSGEVDIGALLRAARARTPRERRAWIAPPAAPRERIARTSTPEHVRHARRRSFVRGALIGGTVMAAVALGPAMVSIARAPQPGPHVDRGAMEPAMVVTIDRRKTPRAAREGVPPTLTQLVITQASVPIAALPITGDEAHDDDVPTLQPSVPRTNPDARGALATTSRTRPAQIANLEPTSDTASDETIEPANVLTASEPSTTTATSEPAGSTEPAPATTANEPLHAHAALPASSSDAVDSSDAPSLPPTLDRLIEDAVGVPRVTPASEATPAPAAPQPAPITTPTRAEVDRSLARARARVEECAAEGHGLANVRITVAGSTGRVMSAVVEGALAGTPAGSCVARAVRGATFPPFAQPTFTIQYPFQL